MLAYQRHCIKSLHTKKRSSSLQDSEPSGATVSADIGTGLTAHNPADMHAYHVYGLTDCIRVIQGMNG